ncbi:MAG: hypothetical protein ACE5F1_23280, partial [Planctomycetota bacterium]
EEHDSEWLLLLFHVFATDRKSWKTAHAASALRGTLRSSGAGGPVRSCEVLCPHCERAVFALDYPRAFGGKNGRQPGLCCRVLATGFGVVSEIAEALAAAQKTRPGTEVAALQCVSCKLMVFVPLPRELAEKSR